MGTGKTRIALAVFVAALSYLPAANSRAALVACPRSVIQPWIDEAALVVPSAKVVPVIGTRPQRERALAQKADIYVINYEGLRTTQETLLEKSAAGLLPVLIFDESQRVSNRAAVQSKVAAKLASHARMVLNLSGTPVRADARDLWHQVMLVDGGKRFGTNYYAFQGANFINVSRTRIPNYKPRKGSEERIRAAYADICYARTKEEVAPELPPKVYSRRVLQPTQRQAQAYAEMAKDMVVQLRTEEAEGTVATATTALTRYLRLLQIAQGFLYDEHNENVELFEPNPKTTELLSILEDHSVESQNKVIVWCLFRHTIRDLMKLLTERGYNPVALYGETSGQGIDKVFQTDPSVRVLIGQPRAGGLGVTLTAADLAVYYTNGFSLEDRRQSEDRNNRIGSEKFSQVTNYIDLELQGTIDQRVVSVLKKKGETSDMLTDLRAHLDLFAQEEYAA